MATTMRTVTTTTTIQQSPNLDNNLDALLEDLQTSVSRPSSALAVNGIGTTSGNRSYQEVSTRTIQNEKSPGYQVQYLSAANPTTVVAERASSPGVGILQQHNAGSVSSYKTVSYQYNTTASSSSSTQPISGLLVDGSSVNAASNRKSDARLQQNLNELDSLLVDLHHAQKAGFNTDKGNVPAGVVNTRTISSSLLEPVEHSTPTQHQLQQVTRVVEQHQTYADGRSSPSPARYQTEPQFSPRLQPKRSSAQRELTYGTVDTQHRTRSPSPMRHPDPSPRVPHRSVVQKESYYETKGSSSSTPRPERYRDKSPSNRRLQKEMYYESSKSSTPIPPSPQNDRYRDPSPPTHRRGVSPMRSEPYPGHPGGTSRVTTVRTYNYSTGGAPAPSPVPPRSGAASPSPVTRSPYPDHPPSPLPAVAYSSASPPPPSTKVTTTVRTYTYDLNGQPIESYPPVEHTSEQTHTYQVSPREKEPFIEPPPPPPTVITYKYSSHASHSTSSKFPTDHEEKQHLLPRPFPTPSPTPTPSGTSEPPKRLDDLMASFSDTEMVTHNQYFPEKHAPHPKPVYPPEGSNGIHPPAPNAKATASAAASATAVATTNASVKDRQKTKNVAGPPVYYPPGVELFAKKEESMMQGSGKIERGRYEYEYAKESKSKSSSSGGAAVVPVCLPLCCAMPCVIM